MAPSPKSESPEAAGKAKRGGREQLSQTTRDSAPAEWAEAQLGADRERAEASMLQDIDAILSRIEDGIAKESKAMDDLLQRIRRPAA